MVERGIRRTIENVQQWRFALVVDHLARACSALIKSGGCPWISECASVAALIRLWEAVRWRGLFYGYGERVIATGGKRGFAARGSRTLRSQPEHGGDLGEVLSRDWPLRAKPRGGSTSPLEKHADFLLALIESSLT